MLKMYPSQSKKRKGFGAKLLYWKKADGGSEAPLNWRLGLKDGAGI
jgi:hypothetical protein